MIFLEKCVINKDIIKFCLSLMLILNKKLLFKNLYIFFNFIILFIVFILYYI